MISKEQAIDIIEKFEFFQGQRAGRELWADKEHVVQEVDLANFRCDCQDLLEYLKETQEPRYQIATIPEKFWLIFDVPGFYDIKEFIVDRTVFVGKKLEKLWGHGGHDSVCVTHHELGRIAFLEEADAKEALQKIIESRRD